jgi:putative tricarboxylic transport membrane protein
MIALKKLVVGTVVALTAAGLSACGSGDSGGGGSSSGRVEVVTHNSVGGGSDVFTRQVIKTMFENDIIDTQWPVRNVPAGDSIGAMAYMAGRSGQEGVISQVTPTWIATPMTVEDAQVTLDQLTPIIMLAEEPQVVVASADSEYETLTDFIEDAKSQPGQLVQSGGSSTANDALTRLVLQDQEDQARRGATATRSRAATASLASHVSLIHSLRRGDPLAGCIGFEIRRPKATSTAATPIASNTELCPVISS